MAGPDIGPHFDLPNGNITPNLGPKAPAKPTAKKPAKKPTPKPTATRTPTATKKPTPTSTTGTTPSTGQPLTTLDQGEMAANFGFALNFIRSDKEISGIFDQAVANGWAESRFIAAIRGTGYFKKHAEPWRQAEILRLSDPQTYNNEVAKKTAIYSDVAAALGAPMSWTQLQALAGNALHFGWNDQQIRDQIAGSVKAVNGVYNGSVGDDVTSLKNTAYRNGIALADSTIQSYAQQIAKGSATRGFFERTIRNMAKTAAPGYADQLETGVDLWDVADPYRQSMAKILELNPADIDLFDPKIRGALTATGADGKPSSKSLWQFENELRQDPRWLSTNNARDAGMSVAHKVLQDFGFSS